LRRFSLKLQLLTLAALALAQTEGPLQERPKPPSNDGWVEIPQKGLPAPKPKPTQPDPAPAPPATDERPPLLRRNPSPEDDRKGKNLPPPKAIGDKASPAKSSTSDSLIDRARLATAAFEKSIPNFICDQVTLRYAGAGRRKGKMQDRIEAEILWVDGQESYRNPRRNGRPIKDADVGETGSWATGDYYSAPLDLLSRSTKADFRDLGDAPIGGRNARKYEYTVQQPQSHWRISFEECKFSPKFRGFMWLDTESARVLRMEMEAMDPPDQCTLDVVETFVEFGEMRIAGETYLLPVKAGNFACRRTSGNCIRNETEFRNYRKFAAESTISTTDSTVTFDDSEPPKLKRRD
jgi:hypothetical protein